MMSEYGCNHLWRMNDSVFIADLGDAGMQNHYHLQQSIGHCYRMSPRSRYVFVLSLVSSSHHHNSQWTKSDPKVATWFGCTILLWFFNAKSTQESTFLIYFGGRLLKYVLHYNSKQADFVLKSALNLYH